jgi:cell fate regulator YaaT (PSP1 superfamily)
MTEETMGRYLGVAFKRGGMIYYFSSAPFVLAVHDWVLVKTEEGIGFGQIVVIKDELPPGLDPAQVKPIYRPATQEDFQTVAENQQHAVEAKAICQQAIARLGLEMKLVDVEVSFDRSKMLFYFTAPGRVDFRELVKDLVRTFRTRIELRQIGVRHETQMLGALGNCGQVCCCRRFLRRFEPVTIKMAKDQNLFLNPAKISGACGRLLCCLAYEMDHYAEFQKRLPKIGRRYRTTQGLVKTLRANMFRDSVTVLTDEGDELDIPLEEWPALVLPEERGSAADRSSERPAASPQKAAESPQPPASPSGHRPPRRGKRLPKKSSKPKRVAS